MIRKFLDLSTAHVTGATAEFLSETPPAHWPVYGGNLEHGWFLCATMPEGDDALPPELCAVVRHARAADCDYVLFDGDAETVDELPTFEWDEPRTLDKIAEADIERAALYGDLDASARFLQTIGGITDGGIASHMLSHKEDEWPTMRCADRAAHLRDWIKVERAIAEEYQPA